MKNIFSWLLISIIAILSSCESHDEPEQPYTGPWEIIIYEHFYGVYNGSTEYMDWFNEHQQYIEGAKFIRKSQTWYILGNDVLYSDYKDYYEGFISWYQIVDKVSEQDLILEMERIEQFSTSEDKNGRFDTFTATYRKYEMND